jgi:hypothetical protein
MSLLAKCNPLLEAYLVALPIAVSGVDVIGFDIVADEVEG